MRPTDTDGRASGPSIDILELAEAAPPRHEDRIGGLQSVSASSAGDSAVRIIESRIIAVVSPKGGLGKTMLAVNLAVGLARIAPEEVVLVDGDLQFGDIANVLAIEPAHTLPQMVAGVASGDDLVVKTLLTPHPAGFFVVPGAESPVEGEQVSGEQLGDLIDQLASIFRYVVVDTTPALGEHTLAVLDRATDAVALSSLAVPNLRSLRMELAVLRSIGFAPSFRHLVLNQAVDPGGLVVKDAAAILEEPIDVVIPHSKGITLSTNRGIPLLIDSPRDPAVKAIAQLLSRITGVDSKTFRTPARRTQR
jgi:MinD-like ATPase involved in chromosome partitioning or flagellar assembly